MKFRILQHEKESDCIRIGRINDFHDSIAVEHLIEIVLADYSEARGIELNDFGQYWKRVAMVDPVTFQTIANIYNECGSATETTAKVDEVPSGAWYRRSATYRPDPKQSDLVDRENSCNSFSQSDQQVPDPEK